MSKKTSKIRKASERKEEEQIESSTSPSSPVCYANSPELRPDFKDEEAQKGSKDRK